MSSATSQSVKLLLRSALLVMSVGLLALACGGGEETPSGGETPTGTADGGDTTTLNVSMYDNFFDPKKFTASPGQELTFNIVNNGALVHNMRIAGGDNEYNTEDDGLSEPVQFVTGATGTLFWTAPETTGTINFKCDFYPVDMTGTITVE